MGVEPVTRLVQRRPDRLEVVRPVARRQPDVAVRERRAERVRRRVEAPGAVLEAERPDDALRELAAAHRGRTMPWRNDASTSRRVADELGQRRPQRREHVAHLGRRHPGLVVVEQRRVGQVGRLEALDVAALELDVRPQVGEERGEVVVPPGLDPGVVPAGRRAGHLDAQLGGHAAGLLPVTARDADQARVVGVVRQRLLERRQPLEQAADLGIGEAVVDDAAEGRERLGARLGSERRHRDPLLPAEHACGAAEVGDLRQPLAECCEIVHWPEPTDRLRPPCQTSS